MIDKEKVIKGLECCRNLNPPDDWDCPEECPYSIESNPHRCCAFDPLLNDALALLQEQEAVKPVVHITNANLTNGANFACGKCGSSFLHKAVNFCPYCGRKVKWDD